MLPAVAIANDKVHRVVIVTNAGEYEIHPKDYFSFKGTQKDGFEFKLAQDKEAIRITSLDDLNKNELLLPIKGVVGQDRKLARTLCRIELLSDNFHSIEELEQVTQDDPSSLILIYIGVQFTDASMVWLGPPVVIKDNKIWNEDNKLQDTSGRLKPPASEFSKGFDYNLWRELSQRAVFRFLFANDGLEPKVVFPNKDKDSKDKAALKTPRLCIPEIDGVYSITTPKAFHINIAKGVIEHEKDGKNILIPKLNDQKDVLFSSWKTVASRTEFVFAVLNNFIALYDSSDYFLWKGAVQFDEKELVKYYKTRTEEDEENESLIRYPKDTQIRLSMVIYDFGDGSFIILPREVFSDFRKSDGQYQVDLLIPKRRQFKFKTVDELAKKLKKEKEDSAVYSRIAERLLGEASEGDSFHLGVTLKTAVWMKCLCEADEKGRLQNTSERMKNGVEPNSVPATRSIK